MGRRPNGCDWCRSEDMECADAYNSAHCIYLTKRQFNNEILITSGAFNERSEEYEELTVSIPFNYCPVCGAKVYPI